MFAHFRIASKITRFCKSYFPSMLSQLYIAMTLPYIFSFFVYNLNVTTCKYFIFYKIIPWTLSRYTYLQI